MQSRGRWLFLIVLLGGIAAFTVVWSAASKNAPGTQPAFGGEYIEGVTGAPARVNPLFAAQNQADATLSSLVFAGLTRLDDQGQPTADLAENWSLSPDGRTYSFHLRPGLVWQDGVELTVDDVLFTYNVLRAPDLRGPPAISKLLADAMITKIDSRTVNLQLTQPFAPLPAYLTLGILPAHLLQSAGAGALFDSPFNQRPIGAGPYRLEQLSADRAVLVANPGYHLGQPYVQHLELRFYRDEGALLTAIKSHQVNAALLHNRLSDADLLYLEHRSDLHETTAPSGETALIYFNLRLPIFQDERVRQALLYALDRDALVKDILGTQAERADSPIPKGSWAYSPALERYGFDSTMAGHLLDEAGWTRANDGARSKAGVTLSFRLATNNDPVNVATAQAVAQDWQAVGVEATVEAGGTTALVRDLLEPRRYEAALFSSVAEADPDPYPAWDSAEAGQSGGNLSSLSDARIDRILEEARLLASPSRRKELYGDFQQLFAQETPAIPLYSTTALYIQPAKLRGVHESLLINAGSRFWQVQEWYLRTR